MNNFNYYCVEDFILQYGNLNYLEIVVIQLILWIYILSFVKLEAIFDNNNSNNLIILVEEK